jgi:hypothetical protein
MQRPYSKSSPGTASGLLLETDMFSAGSAAGNFADVATLAIGIGPVSIGRTFRDDGGPSMTSETLWP